MRLRRADRSPKLFRYQSELADKIERVIEEHGRGLVSLPTGAGKTRTAVIALLHSLQRDSAAKFLWFAPTNELLEQAHAATRQLWRELDNPPDIEIAYKGGYEGTSAIWFTTPHAINADRMSDFSDVRAVVFDEAHQVAAPTFRDALERVADSGCAVIGLSATPGRANEAEMPELLNAFNRNLLVSEDLGPKPVEMLQRRGVLSKLRFHQVPRSRAEVPSQVARLLDCVTLARDLSAEGHRVLVFTASVAGALAGESWLNQRGVSAAYVEGQLDEQERRRRLSLFETGTISVLINQKLLTTGYDCPAVTDVIIEPRVGSPILFEQMVGRAARGPAVGGAAVSTIWQFDDHLEIHGLPQSYYRYRDFQWRVA